MQDPGGVRNNRREDKGHQTMLLPRYKQTFQIEEELYVKGNLVKAIESRMQSLDNLSDI